MTNLGDRSVFSRWAKKAWAKQEGRRTMMLGWRMPLNQIEAIIRADMTLEEAMKINRFNHALDDPYLSLIDLPW